jgi:broad specificity phosphatase PhoE
VLTIILTRHGHTERSEPEQYLGQSVPANLSERGRRDAQTLADRLDGVPIQRVVSSPLGRAMETAAILTEDREVTVEPDQRLTELDYGAWEGVQREEIDDRFPGEFELYDADPSKHHVGGGENGEQVAERVRLLIEDLLAWAEHQDSPPTCLLVGHSSVNRVLLAVVMGLPLIDYRRRFLQDWTNLTVLHWPSRASGPLLMLANDTSHARGLRGATWELA